MSANVLTLKGREETWVIPLRIPKTMIANSKDKPIPICKLLRLNIIIEL